MPKGKKKTFISLTTKNALNYFALITCAVVQFYFDDCWKIKRNRQHTTPTGFHPYSLLFTKTVNLNNLKLKYKIKECKCNIKHESFCLVSQFISNNLLSLNCINFKIYLNILYSTQNIIPVVLNIIKLQNSGFLYALICHFSWKLKQLWSFIITIRICGL